MVLSIYILQYSSHFSRLVQAYMLKNDFKSQWIHLQLVITINLEEQNVTVYHVCEELLESVERFNVPIICQNRGSVCRN